MQGLFFIEEFRVGPASFNLGLRQEDVKVQSLGNPDPTIHRFELGTRRFQPQSYASAAAWQLNSEWRISSNLSHTQRAPKDYELFANGPHIATAAWERGNSQLGIEKAKSLDVSVDWRQGAHQFKLTAFQSRFANFIGLLTTPDIEDGLPVQVYEGVRAKFSGYEASGQWRLFQGAGNLDSTLKVDSVRAINLNTLEYLPRIAPLRLASSLIYSNGPWRASLGFHWHAAQNNVPNGSVATEAYTLWSGYMNYKQKVSGQTLNWFAKLDNLSNQWAYSATSILTSTAPGKSPLPGRSLKFGVLATF
jgi:iron complex outermembrane receptor protein